MSNFRFSSVVVRDEVTTALHEGRGVVALETTIVVHGLPSPVNFEVARSCETAVRDGGSVPATIGVLDGRVVVELNEDELARLADPVRHVAKLSARDLGVALAKGTDGATTVAGTITVAEHVGINVMATGGLGGVHRDATESFDESADLTTLSRRSVLVVASGVKSILDIGATLERLDILGVPVVGFGTRQFPGFYLRDSGFELDWSVSSVEEARWRSSATANSCRRASWWPIPSRPIRSSIDTCTTRHWRVRSSRRRSTASAARPSRPRC